MNWTGSPKDELAKGKEISIKAFQLPVLNSAILDQPLAPNTTLSELFEDTKQELKEAIDNIFKQELWYERWRGLSRTKARRA